MLMLMLGITLDGQNFVSNAVDAQINSTLGDGSIDNEGEVVPPTNLNIIFIVTVHCSWSRRNVWRIRVPITRWRAQSLYCSPLFPL